MTKYNFLQQVDRNDIYIIDSYEVQFKLEDEILESLITFKPLESSFVLKIVDTRSKTYVLEIKKLYDKIEPAESRFVLDGNRLKLHLKKYIETKWYNLVKTS